MHAKECASHGLASGYEANVASLLLCKSLSDTCSTLLRCFTSSSILYPKWSASSKAQWCSWLSAICLVGMALHSLGRGHVLCSRWRGTSYPIRWESQQTKAPMRSITEYLPLWDNCKHSKHVCVNRPLKKKLILLWKAAQSMVTGLVIATDTRCRSPAPLQLECLSHRGL